MYRPTPRDLQHVQVTIGSGVTEALQEVNSEVRDRLNWLDFAEPDQVRPVAKPQPYNVAFFQFD